MSVKGSNEQVTYDDPNRHARPASIEVGDGFVVLRGYQEFVLSSHSVSVLPEDAALARKRELLLPYFGPRFLAGRTVLDLGASGGFFCFWAVQAGADKAVAVDMDPKYVALIEEASSKLGVGEISAVSGKIEEWKNPADVVLALALVHWIYSCTALFGSLDRIVGRLAELCRYMAIIEWVDRQDPAIDFFRHLDWNAHRIDGPYTLSAFEEALSKHFRRHILIGEVSPTRRLYAAFKTDYEIDLSGPLPFVKPIEALISSRRIATDEGIDYWSRVYDAGDYIIKQGTLDLALREAHFLTRLKGAGFPRVYGSESGEGYSVATLEKVAGLPLEGARDETGQTIESMLAFANDCLAWLDELRSAGIVHRDIRVGNILMRNGRPVLIDFGWAIADDCPCFSPQGLGVEGRPPDGSFSDTYSVGVVLDAVNNRRFPGFDLAIAQMTQRDPSMRVIDTNALRGMFASVARDIPKLRSG